MNPKYPLSGEAGLPFEPLSYQYQCGLLHLKHDNSPMFITFMAPQPEIVHFSAATRSG